MMWRWLIASFELSDIQCVRHGLFVPLATINPERGDFFTDILNLKSRSFRFGPGA